MLIEDFEAIFQTLNLQLCILSLHWRVWMSFQFLYMKIHIHIITNVWLRLKSRIHLIIFYKINHSGKLSAEIKRCCWDANFLGAWNRINKHANQFWYFYIEEQVLINIFCVNRSISSRWYVIDYAFCSLLQVYGIFREVYDKLRMHSCRFGSHTFTHKSRDLLFVRIKKIFTIRCKLIVGVTFRLVQYSLNFSELWCPFYGTNNTYTHTIRRISN